MSHRDSLLSSVEDLLLWSSARKVRIKIIISLHMTKSFKGISYFMEIQQLVLNQIKWLSHGLAYAVSLL